MDLRSLNNPNLAALFNHIFIKSLQRFTVVAHGYRGSFSLPDGKSMPLQHASYLPFWQLQSPAADVTAPLHVQTSWDPAGFQLTSTSIHNNAECHQLQTHMYMLHSVQHP